MRRELNNSTPKKHPTRCLMCHLINVCPCLWGIYVSFLHFDLSASVIFSLASSSPCSTLSTWKIILLDRDDVFYKTYSSVSSLSSVNIIFSSLVNEPFLFAFLLRKAFRWTSTEGGWSVDEIYKNNLRPVFSRKNLGAVLWIIVRLPAKPRKAMDCYRSAGHLRDRSESSSECLCCREAQGQLNPSWAGPGTGPGSKMISMACDAKDVS